MDKAFDVVLQSEVDAVTVASTLRTYGEQFRYQCLCCGEEVYLAAADSTTKSPHFRHRRGNNEKDCEHYLRQQGAIERYLLIRKHNKKYVSFYFRFLYKGIIIKHNKTEPTYTKTSLFLCEKRRFFMARTEKGVVTTI